MITQESVEKLQTTVVYLARDPAPPGLLLGAELPGLSQLMDYPEPNASPGGVVLSSMRNQLTVTVNQNTLGFNDGSSERPARLDFPERVARIAEHVGTQSGQSYGDVWFTFAIEARPGDGALPSEAILSRLVRRDALKGAGYDAAGASVGFWYLAHDRWHDLRVEPRENQYDGPNYFALLNVHMDTRGQVPSAEWLSQALAEEYLDFMRVLANILKPL